MDISFLIHDKPPRSVKPLSGTQAAVLPNNGSAPFDVAADGSDGNVKRSHAQMTGETLSTDEGREPKKPRLSERSGSMHYGAFGLHAGNANPPLPAADFRRMLMPALGPYILGETETATSPIPSYGEAGNMPAQHWQALERTHAASSAVSDAHFTAPILPTLLPSHMPFPSLNGMPWLLVAGAAKASVPMPTVSTQRGAEAMLGRLTVPLPGADDGGMDSHASLKFGELYEHMKGRSEEGKVKVPANRFNQPEPLPRNTDTASPLLDQLQAAESGSSVVAQRWKRLQPALDKFLMSCAMFTKPEEFTDYLAVVQIAVLYLDAPLGNGASWQAEAVIADVMVLLGSWTKSGHYTREAKSEQEKTATRERCKSAMRKSLFGLDGDGQRVDLTLCARFIQLLIRVFDLQFTDERLRSLYEKPLHTSRKRLALASEAKVARSSLERREYKGLSCKDLAQAYLNKGGQSELVRLIWNDLE